MIDVHTINLLFLNINCGFIQLYKIILMSTKILIFFNNTLIGCTHLIIFLTIYIASINPIASATI